MTRFEATASLSAAKHRNMNHGQFSAQRRPKLPFRRIIEYYGDSALSLKEFINRSQ